MTPIKFIFTVIFMLTSTTVTLAADKNGYEPISPFDEKVESYAHDVQKIYESLPLIKDTKFIKNNVNGTVDLVNAETETILSERYTFIKEKNTKGRDIYFDYENLLPIGKRTIEIKGLNNDYFWLVYGKVQFFRNIHINMFNKPPTKAIENYFIVMHFQNGSAKANIDYFIVGKIVMKNNLTTLNEISKEANKRRQLYNENAYNETQKKNTWTIAGKSERVTFKEYKNEKVTFKKEENGNKTINVKILSYEDQLLIKGYLDHQGIPIREEKSPGRN